MHRVVFPGPDVQVVVAAGNVEQVQEFDSGSGGGD